MQKILLVALLPLSLLAATPPHGYTHLHYHAHHELRTGPFHTSRHLHNGAAPLLDGMFRVTGFYEQMLANNNAGRFLGVQPSNTQYTLAHINTAATVAAKQADATNNFFVHADPSSNNNLSVKLNAKPSYQTYGALMSYEQYVPLFGGWYAGASAPLADCRTNMNLTLVDRDSSSPGDLASYFAGYHYSDTNKRSQAKLNYNRFDVYEHQRGGFSQVDVWLRKQLLTSTRLRADISTHLTIPLIQPAGAQNLFAPTIGSNGHWVVGASARAELALWNRTNSALSADLHGYIGYNISEKEERIISVSDSLRQWPFGHYSLLTNTGSAANTPLQPAANMLRKSLTVTPGLAHELSGSLSWRGVHLQIDTGYTYHGMQAESGGSWAWEENRFAIAGAKYDTSTTFAAQSATENALITLTDAVGATHTYLQRTDLSAAKALLPAHHGHTIWSHLSYHTRLRALPLSAHAGIAGTVAGSCWIGQNLSTWFSLQLSF